MDNVAAEIVWRQPCMLSSRIYPDYEDGSCDFINTSTPPPKPPDARPLCSIPCAQRDFDTLLVRGLYGGRRTIRAI